MPRYLDPKNDLVFKKIFGEHPALLIDFLNAVLPLPEDGLISELSYLSPEQVPPTPLFYRRSIVDVKCRDQQGRSFIVEMQMFWTPSFQQRMLFSASQAYVQQIAPGQEYRLLQPVYALGLINDVFDKEGSDWYHHYKIVNIDKPEREIKGLQFVFIEIPKFKAETAVGKRIRILWLRFLKEIGQDEMDPPEEMVNHPPICEALELSREAAFSKTELSHYQSALDAIRVEASLWHERTEFFCQEAAEKGMQEGRQKGIQEGMQKGLETGIKKGMERGIEQGIEKGKQEERLAIAIQLLDLLDDATIADKTGLSLGEITGLRERLRQALLG